MNGRVTGTTSVTACSVSTTKELTAPPTAGRFNTGVCANGAARTAAAKAERMIVQRMVLIALESWGVLATRKRQSMERVTSHTVIVCY